MPTSIPARSESGPLFYARSAEDGFSSAVRSAEHGFTLVELMVVVAIIGLTSAAVLLAIPDPRGRVIEDAERFAARTLAARDNAIVLSQPLAVWVSASGYGFEQRRAGQWVAMEDKPFLTTNWREGTSAQVSDVGRTQVVFDSTGLPADPLTVKLVRDGQVVTVRVDLSGKVNVDG